MRKKNNPAGQDGNGLLGIYFQEMSRARTPSRAEEMDLFVELDDRKEKLLKEALQHAKWRGRKNVSGISLYALLLWLKLLPEKEKSAKLAAAEREAIAQRNKIIEANWRLVVSIAREKEWKGLDLPDLIEEGNIGLMKAVGKFECRHGYKLSTYAAWWIHQAIDRAAVDKGSTIRVPAGRTQEIRKLKRATLVLVQEHGRAPAPDELARKLGWAKKKVEYIQKIVREPVNLEAPWDRDGNADGKTLGDILENIKSPSPENAVAEKLLGERIDYHLGQLSLKEERVLRMRFGIGVPYDQTLEEVGEKFGLTRERIRQIEWRGLNKLRRMMKREGGRGGRRFLENVPNPYP
ncbi:MAG: hypothetical protein A3B03_02585 [Candidatus Zambryskibacteria bacterium RIFCSPLOWO2_01_FULL_42_41]|nr:MAG: hypothetical protein A3B03_02585 [Candidatus Zambryskibacteria bacterium RIFCSPLOWO2_01_FULL_42_41]